MLVPVLSLVIQYAKGTHDNVLSSVVTLILPYFFTLSHKGHDFRKIKKAIENKMCVLIFSTTFFLKLSYSKNNSESYHHKRT